MSTQLLFYEQVAAISQKRHSDFCVEGDRNRFEFARGVNSVPLTAVEIPPAAREYSIVFAGNDEAVVPVVILGIEGNDNVYVSDDGVWDASYIPAFVRRYPFVFAQSNEGKTFTLCVDEDWSGCNREGRGERLFDEAGERTAYLSNVLKFLEEYQKQFQLTQAYCRKLQELDLLEEMQAQLTLEGGEKRSLTGFKTVNRDKLKALSGEQLSQLAKTDELELTYTHLQSLKNFSQTLKRTLGQRAREVQGASDTPEPSEPSEETPTQAPAAGQPAATTAEAKKPAVKKPAAKAAKKSPPEKKAKTKAAKAAKATPKRSAKRASR